MHVGDVAGRSRNLVTGTSAIDELEKLGVYVRTNVIPNIPSQVRTTHKFVPRLFIRKDQSTDRFVDVLNNYRYPAEKKETAMNQSNEIPMHDQYSHGARAFEYYCWEMDNAGVEKFLQPKRQKRYDEITGRVLS